MTTMTCLDPNTCPNDKLYNVVCNFSIGYIDYECNSNTCMRADGTYDCCSINVVYCTYPASLLRIPTIQPSQKPIIETNCKQICNTESKIDKCYWYENLRSNNLCAENNNEYCCSQNREDCCSTNKPAMYIVFGCIVGILMIFAYYLYYVKKSRHKIVPAKDVTKVETLDRYKMVINI